MPDPMLDEKDLAILLRLKRFEQPPPGYYEDFLREFQSRQRQEMLKQSVWRIALDRIGAFFSDHATGRLAYGGAALAVLAVAGISTVQILYTPGAGNVGGSNHGLVASAASNSDAASVPSATYVAHSAVSAAKFQAPATVSVAQAGRIPVDAALDGQLPSATYASIPRTHYVIDARPVSYERPSF